MPILIKHRKYVSFTSLKGVKDLILKSTNKPLKLLHAAWNNNKENMEPIKGYIHMFCCHERDKLVRDIENIIIFDENNTKSTATIIQRGMDNCDWKFILTSDI